MEDCGDHSGPLKSIFRIDYLLQKSSWCVKNNYDINHTRLCKYIEQIIQLSTNSFTLGHLFYAIDVIEYLAENVSTEPSYEYYLKRMLVLCLMPPTVTSAMDCSTNISTLIRFYDVMAKCIGLVHAHAELSILLFGVLQLSVLRPQPVPENSVDLRCCYAAIEMSDLPKNLMRLIENVSSRTFLDDLLKLSYNIAALSERSVLHMVEADGIKILVDVLKPNFLSMIENSHEHSTVCEYVILLLNRMFYLRRKTTTSEMPRITRNTLEIIFYNIKNETVKNVVGSMKMRNDFCYVLDEMLVNCSIDEQEFSNDMITDVVMMCVWPEIIHISHWLDSVKFNFAEENFAFKNIMLDIMNKMFVHLSQKIEFQHLNTFLIKTFTMLLDDKYTKNSYGDNIHTILIRFLLILPYSLLNSIDNATKDECCTKLLSLMKSLHYQECYSRIMVNAIICIGIVSNDSYDSLWKFKMLKTDVLINSVILEALDHEDHSDFQNIILYGINTLNIFFRENQHNPEIQPMVLDMVMKMVKSSFLVEQNDSLFNQKVMLDFLHFIKNAIVRYDDQIHEFVESGGIEKLLDVLSIAKYPIQLVLLSILVEFAAYCPAKVCFKKWKSKVTKKGYLELLCEIWRREKVRFNFLDDEFVFLEQRDRTTVENLINECSPTVESMYLCAQPKIFLLMLMVEFSEDPKNRYLYTDDNDIRENTVRACDLVRDFQDKATVAHIYHYYSLKLGEIWTENDLVSRGANDEQDAPPSVESQSVDIMMVRHAYLIALIRMIRSQVANLNVDQADIELENKLYEEIRRYHSNLQ